jgi:hypothetical protein
LYKQRKVNKGSWQRESIKRKKTSLEAKEEEGKELAEFETRRLVPFRRQGPGGDDQDGEGNKITFTQADLLSYCFDLIAGGTAKARRKVWREEKRAKPFFDSVA